MGGQERSLCGPAVSPPISKIPQAGVLEAQGAKASLMSQDAVQGKSSVLATCRLPDGEPPAQPTAAEKP